MNSYIFISSLMYLMHQFQEKNYVHFINASEYMLLFKRPKNSQKLLENEYRRTFKKFRKLN